MPYVSIVCFNKKNNKLFRIKYDVKTWRNIIFHSLIEKSKPKSINCNIKSRVI